MSSNKEKTDKRKAIYDRGMHVPFFILSAYQDRLLTNCRLEAPKRVIGKECKLRLDAAECGV